MENLTVSGLRSRSRSKTPFLRSSCDHENCLEGEDHSHLKSGRKTPIRRSTPIKQLSETSNRVTSETLTEVEEEQTREPAHRTRQSTKNASEKLAKTSDYSSEESLDRLKGNRKEIFQNELNSQYERVSTSSQRYTSLSEVTLSPIYTSQYNNYSHSTSHGRSRSRIGSPTYSACSTDSSFAEQALADTSLLLEKNPNSEHLPSRLYKMAREYWNKYPKTDYTYSPLSKDRVELAPGQVAMPNMSRRSLSQFRVQGPNTNIDEIDRISTTTSWTSNTLRRRYTSLDSSDDETQYVHKGGHHRADERWWLTKLLMTVLTTITTSTSNTYRKLVGPSHRYPYTDRRPAKASILSQATSVVSAPFTWLYTMIKTVITTTVTTITETLSSNNVEENKKYAASGYKVKAVKRKWWPWFLLLLLPAVGYGSHYTYENWEHLSMPNFTNFHLDLSEFHISKISFPNITIPSLGMLPNITTINITLPNISENLPEVTKTYQEYKVVVKDRMADASDYVKIVANSCFEEVKHYWRGITG